MRTLLAACIAPCASPLLTAIYIYAWVVLHVGAQSQELARWVQFDDLWPLFLGEFVLVFVITWCGGYPIFAMARSRNGVSALGLCIAGTLTGALIFFLIAVIASLPSMFSLVVLFATVIGGIKGAAVATMFSRLAGVPSVASHSMLLQSDVTKSDA